MKTCYMIAEIRAIADLTSLGGNTWELNRINVPVQYRGRGYGTELMNMILADADSEGQTILLWVNPHAGLWAEPTLRAWYTRHGWITNQDGSMTRPPRG